MRAIDLLAQMQASRIHLALGGRIWRHRRAGVDEDMSSRSSANRREHDSDEPPAIVRQPDTLHCRRARQPRRRPLVIGEISSPASGKKSRRWRLSGNPCRPAARARRSHFRSGNFEIEVLDADPRRVKRLRIATRKEAAYLAPAREPPREAAPERAPRRPATCGPAARRRSRFAVIVADKFRAAGLAIILSWGWKRAALRSPRAHVALAWRRSMHGGLFLTFRDGLAGRRRGAGACEELPRRRWRLVFGLGYFVSDFTGRLRILSMHRLRLAVAIRRARLPAYLALFTASALRWRA